MPTGDEHFYAQVADELESGQLEKGAWTKALAMNNFDADKARGDYMRFRVAQLSAAHKPDLITRIRAFGRGYREGVEEVRRRGDEPEE